MKRVKLLLLNLLLLTGTTLLMRVCAMIFNVWITNKIGAEGIGLFSLIMSVYAFGVTIATSAVNLAASRMTAEAQGRGNAAEVRAAMRRCIVYSLIFGFAASILLFVFAEPIGRKALGDVRTISSLKLLSATLPMLSLSSALSGYFTAARRVYKNVFSQVFEQFIKITVTAFALTLMSGGGIEYACLAIVIGSVVSGLMSLMVSVVLYIWDIKKHIASAASKQDTAKLDAAKNSVLPRGLTKKLLSITIPVSAGAYIRSGLVTIEHILIPFGLKKYGAGGSSAVATYGIIHGMAFPVIFFPQAFLGAFAGLLVPEVAESRAEGKSARISYIISRVFQITMTFSVGVAGILMFFSAELSELIYHNSEAGIYIRAVSPLIPVMYLDSAVDAMLKGLDEQVYSMRVNIIDAAMSVVLVYTLLPAFGINGYIIMVYATEIINAAMSITRLLNFGKLKIRKVRISLIKWLFAPLFCIIGATSAVKIVSDIANIGASGHTAIGLAAEICVTCALYAAFLLLTSAVTRDDVRWAVSVVH